MVDPNDHPHHFLCCGYKKDARAKLELKKTKTQKLAPKRRKKKDANKVKVISYEKDEDAKLERRKVKVRSFVNPGTVLSKFRRGFGRNAA